MRKILSHKFSALVIFLVVVISSVSSQAMPSKTPSNASDFFGINVHETWELGSLGEYAHSYLLVPINSQNSYLKGTSLLMASDWDSTNQEIFSMAKFGRAFEIIIGRDYGPTLAIKDNGEHNKLQQVYVSGLSLSDYTVNSRLSEDAIRWRKVISGPYMFHQKDANSWNEVISGHYMFHQSRFWEASKREMEKRMRDHHRAYWNLIETCLKLGDRDLVSGCIGKKLSS